MESSSIGFFLFILPAQPHYYWYSMCGLNANSYYEDYLSAPFPFGSYTQVFISPEIAISSVSIGASLSIFSSHFLFDGKVINKVCLYNELGKVIHSKFCILTFKIGEKANELSKGRYAGVSCAFLCFKFCNLFWSNSCLPIILLPFVILVPKIM